MAGVTLPGMEPWKNYRAPISHHCTEVNTERLHVCQPSDTDRTLVAMLCWHWSLAGTVFLITQVVTLLSMKCMRRMIYHFYILLNKGASMVLLTAALNRSNSLWKSSKLGQGYLQLGMDVVSARLEHITPESGWQCFSGQYLNSDVVDLCKPLYNFIAFSVVFTEKGYEYEKTLT